MKTIGFCILLFGLTFNCYSRNNQATNLEESRMEVLTILENDKDKAAIQQLIRQVLTWVDEESLLSLFPMLEDNTNSVYNGVDLDEHKQNLQELESTNFFSKAFLDNYNKIYLAINEKLKNKAVEWLVGDMSPFGNGTNPWCNCQDIPYDEPNPWEFIEIEVVDLSDEKGEFIWRWGNLPLNAGIGWKEFTYQFSVVKEEGKWKIAYLEGFDFDTFISGSY